MSESVNRQCPFCGVYGTVTSDRFSSSVHRFDQGNVHGDQALTSAAFVCPNPECREYTLMLTLADSQWQPISSRWVDQEPRQRWTLIPSGSVKPFPDYIPAPILADYREACLIRELSPKASATLARRCLQGMIRDYWKVSKPRLADEIDALRDKLDPLTWDAIDAVRNIGNIGAHMERDINLVVDVDPDEAGLLIGLIETLLTEWYVNRHEREQRMTRLVGVAQQKKEAKALPTPSGQPKGQ